ncbi:MAG: NFACT family protein, partial [Bacilli bacterium]|nr:NFACT family protein [Bacilli bacterium]
ALINAKVKSSRRKITTIEGDIEKAKQHANDGQYGTFIFTNMDELDASTGKMDYYGEEIALDKRKSLSENAETFFKRQKKAKAALQVGEANLAKAKAEAIRYKELQAILPHCAEEGLRRLSEEFACTPLTKSKKKAGGIKYAESLLPYEIVHNGVTYWFGKSARENDFLSFALDTDKNHIWMHVKGTHGAHLIIRKANPSNEELSFGCEICLLASSLDDGEVMYCEKSQVRKGNVPGQAIVKEYQSATFRRISKEAREAYESSGRIGR